MRSGLLCAVAIVTGIKALGDMPEQTTWIIGGAAGVVVYFVHRMILKAKIESAIKLLILQR